MTWSQSHLKELVLSPFLGCQLPEQPVEAWNPRSMPGFGVWGSYSQVRSLDDSPFVGPLTRKVYSRIQEQTKPYIEMATTILPWKSLTRSPSRAAGSSKSSADLSREVESITRAISSEFDSNPALRDLRLQNPTILPNSINERPKFPATWSCKKSLYHCTHKWYIPVKTYDPRDTQDYLQIFAGNGYVDIYVPANKGQSYPSNLLSLPTSSLEEIIAALEAQEVDENALLRYLKGEGDDLLLWDLQCCMSSLSALYFAYKVYSNLPDARVELSITKSTLEKYLWSRPTDDNLAHARSLSCIAAFETGDLNIHPKDLKEVMGISAGSSLYIAQFLWSDPFSPPPSNIVRRSIGNVGKPGIAFLISPNDPSIKDPGFDNWQSVQHDDFDGKFENNFPETSLHLSFTGYELALNTGQHGLRDKEVYFLQAVVQAYERGIWVADLDILSALNNAERSNRVLRLPAQCQHTSKEALELSSFGPVTSVDCWAELLDQPNNPSIVRAKGNWLARLAATVVAFQKKRQVLIASEKVCWACVTSLLEDRSLVMIIC